MRIKNKEIRNRRHRKEQTIKAANRELREKYGDKPKAAAAAAPAPEKAKAKKPAAEKAAEPKKAPVKKAAPKAEGTEEAKPKAKRAPKKAEDAPAE